MKVRNPISWAWIGAAGALVFTLTLNADPPRQIGVKSEKSEQGKDAAKSPAKKPGLAEAREQARLMHRIHAATLEVMHRHYFRENRPVLPARALEDVFAEIDEGTGIRTRWISVNTPAMSIQHQPKSDFEKRAAAAISSGKEEYGGVENGYYLRAGAIPLGSGCVGCHTRFAQQQSKTPRFAALVIAIPLAKE